MILQKDVVIVGAGMVGLSLALALHKKGLQVAVVEAKSTGSKALDQDRIETRVSAINHTSKRFLKELDVWDVIRSYRVSLYYKMQVWDDDLDEKISITAEEISEHSLGCVVENDAITTALLEKISQTGIEIFDNQKIREIQRYQNIAKVILEDKAIKTNLVVGADGANSFIRDYFNFETKVKPYGHTSIVATLEFEKEHNQTAYQRFYDKGVLAFLPLEDRHKVSIVWSVKTDYANYLISLKEQDFEKALVLASGNILGNTKLLSKRFSFELLQRHAKSYIQDKVVLVGDAAHSIHPLAGQGVNIGFKDVISLTNVLGETFAKGRLLGAESTLDKYQRDRKLDNTKMIALMKTFKEVFGSDNEYLKKIRRLGLKFVDENSFIKRIIVKQAL
ncbi:UbiH/UbiF/VisC/COQ6 family ubiquinone biosynthesis hydroxylase [Allofrancisella guangzhouensis]|uniref:2-octaprenyl-3-methyl-6-methoxy-1,4-benzoquinol hydroxylase n=1 Tax=Allofrancisella guangzhouensis TaxID=594679 RepID=A0A0A8E6E9_9GAMM|nr:UbiH/UbiF/VisC/COQ6 family ubiquinone biosynthesis hydroxylase [Allofrancisella guangzhouensis]AJC49152.1 2-octaprenyl-3-methyl-6-methoxy-1,4-benzoquinol hydroxylase [Allofrancisella guangzhouensis]MBK2026874.1 UbiH/UbiF/VisC/COQ6 family ubiquinone biosynthesis hydroxylase [Allofrancisella guangzhouensis]MBK2044016.1 UbiH/UbiF/VisC/COQ6 family ubiquinone biosynthesis hydroxylase [Allofrancisella guangzhouensis]MBK2045336.1 UbiH/UbiF/VisC/COQ6 family ubiquinone biosynthesis hydroxylase [Allof